MDLAATADDALAHVGDDERQTVCADMGMGVGQDGSRSTMLAEDVEDLLHAAALLRPRVEFTVGERACPTLSKTVVGLGVDGLRMGDGCEVALALLDALATLQDDRAHTHLYQAQRSEKTAGACADNDRRGLVADVRIVRGRKRLLGRELVDVGPNLEIDQHAAVARVDGSLHDPHGANGRYVKSFLLRQVLSDGVLRVSLLREQAELIFFYHAGFAILSCLFVNVLRKESGERSSYFYIQSPYYIFDLLIKISDPQTLFFHLNLFS